MHKVDHVFNISTTKGKKLTVFNAYILVEQASSIALLHAKPGSTLLALCYYSAMWQLCVVMMSWVRRWVEVVVY